MIDFLIWTAGVAVAGSLVYLVIAFWFVRGITRQKDEHEDGGIG